MPAPIAPEFAAMDAAILARFGESCVFKPRSGDARTVIAACDEGQVVQETANRDLATQHRLEVLVMRDPNHATLPGIDVISFGDSIRRATDPEGEVFCFEGEHLERNDSAWKLAFVRWVVIQRGGNRQ